MYKFLLPILLMLSGCANFTVGGTMCDQMVNEQGQIIPKECRNYNEDEADKAFNKLVEDKKVSDKDIQFDSEEDK